MTFRQVLQQIHLWLALTLCIPLVLLGLTGSILVYHDDFGDWFGESESQIVAAGEPAPLDVMIAAAQAAAGEGFLPSMVTLGTGEESGPATIRFAPAPSGQSGQQGQQGNMGPGGMGPGGMSGPSVTLDPVSLKVLEVRQGNQRQGGFMGVMHRLHGSLMIPGLGRDIVGWLGIVMVFLGISGIIMWWPRLDQWRGGQWRQALTIKRGATTLRFNKDLHNTFGFWSLGVFLIVSFTGVYIVYPQPINATVGLASPVRDLRPNAVTVKPVAGITVVTPGAALALAFEAVAEDQSLQSISLPVRANQPYRFSFARPDQDGPMFNTNVFVDPYAGRVIEARDPAGYNAGETFALYQRPLHYGLGWGPIWKFLVFLSGLLPLLFSITGITLWWMKRQRRQKAAREREALQTASPNLPKTPSSASA
ncbi:PepSY-associated TM helix domain-containing protein [Dongia sp.]|uniref:PepSY-associated TM helix domain-containing protein n=1 Tax=Dongia sp. TaxID=1977262 RepID=UPI0035B47D37